MSPELTRALDDQGWEPRVVWTSHYGGLKVIPGDIARVRISLYAPRWITGVSMIEAPGLMVPPWVLHKSKADERWDWRAAYREHLGRLRQDGRLLEALADLPDPCVLLCYERDWEDCHRKIAWEALRDDCGVRGGEWGGRQEAAPARARPKPSTQEGLGL